MPMRDFAPLRRYRPRPAPVQLTLPRLTPAQVDQAAMASWRLRILRAIRRGETPPERPDWLAWVAASR